jgi:hypothetical protein
MSRTNADVPKGPHLHFRDLTTRCPRPIGRYLRDGLANWRLGWLLDQCSYYRGNIEALKPRKVFWANLLTST